MTTIPPAAWSTVDWYGVTKIAYHLNRQAFRPLHSCVLFERLSSVCEPLALPVYLLDDVNELAGSDWQVSVRAYDSNLEKLELAEFNGSGSVNQVCRLGEFRLSADQTFSTPLFVVSEVRQNGELKDRTFYWLNYTAIQGSLFTLPRTQLSLVVDEENSLSVINQGNKPAVAVHFVCPTISDKFTPADSFFWLDPGEQCTIAVNFTDGVTVAAWNTD